MCPKRTDSDGPDSDRDARPSRDEEIIGLKARILVLEEELAEYGRKFGLTDRARELLKKPIAE